MKQGNLPDNIKCRSIYRQLQTNNPGGFNGHRGDISVNSDGEKRVASVSSVFAVRKPESFYADIEISKLMVRVAAMGLYPAGLSIDITLPVDAEESDMRNEFIILRSLCEEKKIPVLYADASCSASVTDMMVNLVMTGISSENNDYEAAAAINPEEAASGLSDSNGQTDIVMLGYTAVEGTAILSFEHEKNLRAHYPGFLADNGLKMKDAVDISEGVRIAFLMGGRVYPAGPGGILGAIWNLSESEKTGIEADLKKIILKQETVEITDHLGINPYRLLSGGAALVATDNSKALLGVYERAGIPAAIIGRCISGNDRVIINDEDRAYLEPAGIDEYYKTLE